LQLLSQAAGTELEPYPIDVAAAHLNIYAGGRRPIAFHSDGAAFVELIPLDCDANDEAATLVFRGERDTGLALLRSPETHARVAAQVAQIPHVPGASVLLQGRRLLHTGSVTARNRILLVLPLRSEQEPWKDDNTIARLAMDYKSEEFLAEWVEDELRRKLPAYRRSTSTSP
jgi:hypothetical protein